MPSNEEKKTGLKIALGQSEQILYELKELADFFNIPNNFVNLFTTHHPPWVTYEAQLKYLFCFFKTTSKKLQEYIPNFPHPHQRNKIQTLLYMEFAALDNLFSLYQSCQKDSALMMQWVRAFSALPIVSFAMSNAGIKKGIYGGMQTFYQNMRGIMSWNNSGHIKFTLVISSLNILIQNSAKYAGIKKSTNQEVDDIILEARLANLMDDTPTKSLVDQIVEAFMNEMAIELLSKLVPAGIKACPGA